MCFGEATKVCQYLLDADKHYVSEFTFGQRTSTGDSEGEVLEQVARAEHLDPVSLRPLEDLSDEGLVACAGRRDGQLAQGLADLLVRGALQRARERLLRPVPGAAAGGELREGSVGARPSQGVLHVLGAGVGAAAA